MSAAGRHAWSERVVHERYSDRACWYCGLIKRSRHEGIGRREFHWTEWWRDGVQIESKGTPPCPGPKLVQSEERMEAA